MPQVPLARPASVQSAVAPTVRVGTQAPEGAFGGGRAMAGLVDATQDTLGEVNKIRQDADRIRVQESTAKALNAKNQLALELSQMKGENAFKGEPEIRQKFDKAMSEIESGLTSPSQRNAFREQAMGVGMEFNTTLQKHLVAERQEYNKNSTESALLATRDDAVINYADPVLVAKNLQKQTEIATAYAQSEGLDPASSEQLVKKTTSATRRAVVERMLTDGEDMAAEQTFNSMKDGFTATDLLAVEAAVKEGSTLGFAQRTTDALMARGLTQTQALTVARDQTKDDPKRRKALEGEIRQRYQMARQAEKEDQDALFERTYDQLRAGKTLKEVAPALAAMGAQQRETLEGFARNPTKNTVSDPVVKYDLEQMAAADPAAFLQVNLLQKHVSGEINASDFEYFSKARAAIVKQDTNAMASFGTPQKILTDTAVAAGFDPSKDKEELALMNRRLREQMDAQFAATGKKPTPQEIQLMSDMLLIEGKVYRPGRMAKFLSGLYGSDFSKGRMAQKELRAFEAEPGETFVVDSVKSIPPGIRNQIANALREEKMEVSDEAILRSYNYFVMKQGPK